jgi:DNA-binding MarR family transcriptional regulator
VTAIETTPTHAAPAERVPRELLDSASFLLKRLGFAVKERTMAAFEAAGFSPYHYSVLVVLDEGARETQGSIADALGYDRGQLVGILDELEERGLVERRRDPNDRRRHLVTLTAEGKRALTKLRALSARIENEFFAPIGDEERATLHALLLRLAEAHEPRCAPPPAR